MLSACLMLLIGCANFINPNTTPVPTPVITGAATVQGAVLHAGPLQFPAGFMTSIKSYGAMGDGVTDDTAAIQRALADGRSSAAGDYYALPKALYFPPGVYLVHDTLAWNGCCVTLQGSGSFSSIIRLAPASPGFTNSANPKPVVFTPAGNQSFHQNIWDIGFAVGPGNAGATVLSYISNNSGSIHNVQIVSEDGKGHAGIDLTRNYAGPLMIRDAQIQGFDFAVDLQNAEYSVTMEGITISGQGIAGIRNVNQSVSLRRFVSTNTVPALTNNGGLITLLDAALKGGTPGASAIQTNTSMYLRNISSTGYGHTLSNTSGVGPSVLNGQIVESVIGKSDTLIGQANGMSLKLPINETPVAASASLLDSTAFVPTWYGDTSELQPALNSGHSTIYFPFGRYFSYSQAQVTVPDTVQHIVGFSSIVNGAYGNPGGSNQGGIRLIVSGNSPYPLIIEQFGYGLTIDHRGTRPVVLKDGYYNYISQPGAGDLYLEDTETASLVLKPGQHVWARQLNDEISGTKIQNDGAALWILGLKTEQAGTVINTTDDGQTELLGGLVYPATVVPGNQAAFQSTDSQASYVYSESVYCSNCGYAIQVQQIVGGDTYTMPSSPNQSQRIPLFIGYQ